MVEVQLSNRDTHWAVLAFRGTFLCAEKLPVASRIFRFFVFTGHSSDKIHILKASRFIQGLTLWRYFKGGWCKCLEAPWTTVLPDVKSVTYCNQSNLCINLTLDVSPAVSRSSLNPVLTLTQHYSVGAAHIAGSSVHFIVPLWRNSVTCLRTNYLTAHAVDGAKSQIMRKAVLRFWLACTAVDRSPERRWFVCPETA